MKRVSVCAFLWFKVPRLVRCFARVIFSMSKVFWTYRRRWTLLHSLCSRSLANISLLALIMHYLWMGLKGFKGNHYFAWNAAQCSVPLQAFLQGPPPLGALARSLVVALKFKILVKHFRATLKRAYHSHTHTHAHTHTHMRAHTHTHTHTCALTLTHAHRYYYGGRHWPVKEREKGRLPFSATRGEAWERESERERKRERERERECWD